MKIRKNPSNLNKNGRVIDKKSTRLIDSTVYRKLLLKKKEDQW